MTQPSTQSQLVGYELHSLGWKAFQDLCSTIMSEVLGQTVQSFLPTHDGGRDGAFHGVWVPTQSQRHEGSFTVQCKFSSNKEHRRRRFTWGISCRASPPTGMRRPRGAGRKLRPLRRLHHGTSTRARSDRLVAPTGALSAVGLSSPLVVLW